MITPDILADIKFYFREHGGRSMPTPADFFSCICVIGPDNHDARLLLEEIGSIFPGDEKENVPMKFLCADLVIPKIKIGDKFYIRDAKIVGEAIVKKIININPDDSSLVHSTG